MGTPRAATSARTLDVGRLLLVAAALASAGAGIGHLSAVRDHGEHLHIAAFFAVLAVTQLAWAAIVASRPTAAWTRVGMAGQLAVVGIWVLSRTVGLPIVPGATDPEPVGLADAGTTFLELIAVAGVGLYRVLPDPARRAAVASPDRVLGVVMAAIMAVTFPAALATPSRHHGDGGHGAPGHGDAGVELAAGRAHGDGHMEGDDANAGADAHGRTHAGRVLSHTAEHVDAPPALAAGHGSHPAGPAPMEHDEGNGHPPGDGHGTHEDGTSHHGDSGSGSPAPVGEPASVRYGPLVVPPAATNEVRHLLPVLSNTVLADLPPPCADCYVTEMRFDLVDGDGRSMNYDTGLMNHHLVMFNSVEHDPVCGRLDGPGALGRRIFGAGNERTALVLPRGFGYHIAGDDLWAGIFEVMNFTDETKVVYMQVDVRYLPDSDQSVKAAEPWWLDVEHCSDSQFDVAAGRTTTSGEWMSKFTGRVVALAGHVHDGGVSVAVDNTTTGRRVCKSVARYGTTPAFQGHIESMSLCSWDRVGVVRRGDTLKMSAVYDTPEALEGVMGITMAWVYETDDLEGGTQAPDSMIDPPDGGAPAPPAGGHDH